jgi:hypothetical protein
MGASRLAPVRAPLRQKILARSGMQTSELNSDETK